MQMQGRLGVMDEEKASSASDSRNLDVPAHHETAADSNVINRLIRTTLIATVDRSGLVHYRLFRRRSPLLRSGTSTHCFQTLPQATLQTVVGLLNGGRPETAALLIRKSLPGRNKATCNFLTFFFADEHVHTQVKFTNEGVYRI